MFSLRASRATLLLFHTLSSTPNVKLPFCLIYRHFESMPFTQLHSGPHFDHYRLKALHLRWYSTYARPLHQVCFSERAKY